MFKSVREIEFNFEGEDTSYLTHSLHPYPAKFPPQLPKRILERYAVKGQTVLDPFCGSGTTLIEARIFGVNEILSSDLSNHSKIINPTFAQKGKKEHLIILQKQ